MIDEKQQDKFEQWLVQELRNLGAISPCDDFDVGREEQTEHILRVYRTLREKGYLTGRTANENNT